MKIKTTTRLARLSETKANTLLGAVLFLSVICAVAPSAPAQGSLIAWWPGDGNANDVIGGHHGSFFNGATTAPGIIGQAFSFDGTDDYVQIPNSSFLPQLNASRTVTLWFKSNKNLVDSPESSLFFYGDEGAGNGFVFSLITSSNARGKLYWFGWGVPPFIDLPGVTTLQQDRWYFAAVTYDSSQNLINLWLGSEGILHHEGARHPGSLWTTGANGPNGVLIGAREDWPRWDGLIDEVKVYNRALTYEELLSQFLPPANQPPLATDDYYGTNQASSLSVPSPGVLSNDSDADEDPLTVELVTGPANGALQLNTDGSFSYTPLPYFYGVDSFTYRANDGAISSEIATVEITVSQPGSQGFITGGGKFFQAGRKSTFGFVAKVQATGVQGSLEFQDHDLGINVRSQTVQWVYSPDPSEGSFSGTCTVNGVSGYTFFVQVHDLGGDNFTIWVFDAFNSPVYSAGGALDGGNIKIHGG